MQEGTEQSALFVDHYSLLGVGFQATTEEIKIAFRQQARLHHPDRPGGNALRFLEAYTAYSTLKDRVRRQEYDLLYRIHKENRRIARYIQVPASRFLYPESVVNLARRGLLRRKFSRKDRSFYLRINYDLELPLSRKELRQPILLHVPVVARTLCPDCHGSDLSCYACGGKGFYKASRSLKLEIHGGLAWGQILELDLWKLRPEPLSHYKKRSLRIKIIAEKLNRTGTS